MEEVGGTGQHRVRPVPLGGVGAQRDAQLAHQPGGAYVVPLDVTDDQGEAPSGQRDHVVPVAADLEAAAGGDVAGGDAHAGDLRAEHGQHAALEPVGQLPLGLGGARPGEGLGQHPRHGGQHRALVRGEGHRVGEGGHPRAHRAAGHRQRQEGPGAAAVALGERPGEGIAGPVLLGGGQIDGAAGADHLGGRVVGVQRHVHERVHVAVRLTVVADDRQTVPRDAEDRQSVGGEARHRQARRDAQDLLRGPRLGQRPARVQKERLARAAPLAGDRAASGGCPRGGLGDLLERAGQLVGLAYGVEGRLGAAAHHADQVALLVHDPDADLGEGALGDGELDHTGDLVPVHGVQPGPYLGLGEQRALGGQPEQPGRLRVHPDLSGGGVPVPQAGREGGKDVPHLGQGVTSAHCPTLRRSDRTLPPLARRQGGGAQGWPPGTLGLFQRWGRFT